MSENNNNDEIKNLSGDTEFEVSAEENIEDEEIKNLQRRLKIATLRQQLRDLEAKDEPAPAQPRLSRAERKRAKRDDKLDDTISTLGREVSIGELEKQKEDLNRKDPKPSRRDRKLSGIIAGNEISQAKADGRKIARDEELDIKKSKAEGAQAEAMRRQAKGPRRKWKRAAAAMFAVVTTGVFGYDAAADRINGVWQYPEPMNNLVDAFQDVVMCDLVGDGFATKVRNEGATHEIKEDVKLKLHRGIDPSQERTWLQLNKGDRIDATVNQTLEGGHSVLKVTSGTYANRFVSVRDSDRGKFLQEVTVPECSTPRLGNNASNQQMTAPKQQGQVNPQDQSGSRVYKASQKLPGVNL